MTRPVVASAIEALALLGAGTDPECWILWGDDPGVRYTILAPAAAGLVTINVRVNVPGEGPRAAGKIVRWQRVQIGELSVEVHGDRRMITFQVESQLLRGANEEATEIAAFVDGLFAAMDGRSAAFNAAIALPAPSAPRSADAGGLVPGPKVTDN